MILDFSAFLFSMWCNSLFWFFVDSAFGSLPVWDWTKPPISTLCPNPPSFPPFAHKKSPYVVQSFNLSIASLLHGHFYHYPLHSVSLFFLHISNHSRPSSSRKSWRRHQHHLQHHPLALTRGPQQQPPPNWPQLYQRWQRRAFRASPKTECEAQSRAKTKTEKLPENLQ